MGCKALPHDAHLSPTSISLQARGMRLLHVVHPGLMCLMLITMISGIMAPASYSACAINLSLLRSLRAQGVFLCHDHVLW